MANVRMQGPANSGGFSFDGVSYEADENDIIEIPGNLIEHAKPHGFSLIAEKGPKKLEPLAKGESKKLGLKSDEKEGADDAKSGGGK